MKLLFVSLIIYGSLLPCAQSPPQTLPTPAGVTGNLKRHERFTSTYVDPRNVDVWLPPGYEQNKSRRFSVVYMHDGQNLFDPKLSFIGVDWGIDETMTRLIGEGKIREAIVVGVWNTPKRVLEYLPQKAMVNSTWPLKGIPALRLDQIVSDNYLKFLVTELKPFIDSTYRTRADRKDTFIMGSSAGALISVYTIAEYPNVFGGAGCISTHWPVGDGIVIDYLKDHLPDPKTHEFYFDFGTETLDAGYEPYQRKMDELMRKAGYKEGKNWITRKFAGDEHSERAWRKRVDVPLIFFLHK
ncbi:MAG: alpha/beta hydrolase-fold protein [Pyrinomonadaceae bacterium]|nr:alpha/beta hydrolase-fold protein [Pyrinomonadaceae bacterium]